MHAFTKRQKVVMIVTLKIVLILRNVFDIDIQKLT